MHMQTLGRLQQTEAILAGLFDMPVAVGVTDPRQPRPAPMGQEAAHLDRAIASRKSEFAAGRAAARIAMARLNLKAVPIPAAPDRAPIWPEGVSGSISHKKTLCAAVVTQAPFSVGLDIEQDTDLEAGLLSSICSETELARIAGPRQRRLAKLVFSAKEAVYKAQYPLTQELFGFDHIDLALDVAQRRFTATFLRPAGRFCVGDTLPGRFDMVADHLVTVAWTGKGMGKGA